MEPKNKELILENINIIMNSKSQSLEVLAGHYSRITNHK